jgi:hypothetical protein
VLLPSLREGRSPDDFSFQVITKMPYPDLGDPWTAGRRHHDPRWYALETAKALVQAYGRSCRHGDDYGTTYLLDGQFERFLALDRALLPEWFLEAADAALRRDKGARGPPSSPTGERFAMRAEAGTGHERPAMRPEDGAGHEPGPLMLIEEAPPAAAARAGDRLLLAVDHLPGLGDPEAAEGERDTGGDGEADVGGRVIGQGPVGFGGRDPPRPLAVLDGRVVLARLHRGVVRGHGAHEAPTSISSQASSSKVMPSCLVIPRMWYFPQVGQNLLIEDRKAILARLLDDGPAADVVVESAPCPRKALAADVDDEPQVGGLEVVAHLAVAVPGR